MNDRNRQILEAAWRVFSRYGISKTTMNDIAREAGVARQTLYNAYAGKDEVFRAVVRLGGNETLEQVRAAWENAADLPTKIDIFYAHGPITWYDMIEAAPDAEGLLEGFTGAAKAELEELASKWGALIAAALEPHRAAILSNGSTPEAFAEFFYATAKSAKYNAPSRDAFMARLQTLRVSTLAMTGQPVALAKSA
ncbi:Transcriptional regulator, TetR family [Candidatus Rhodobacter oscarellae]|uniref:Transcriptional regulator, TetR family n=1 Tax=Candidatus Rhodobacter oscarellae TaxID=1675527 RepID=A0A0J9E7V1_9RHOB|nr:TetR/AcrR family transcriptional regulator [Candidatus Rhodobacter lobularis]KMW58807.1 Transcriptional regulator, TetR family [Candidatus Rhodobacter lobularis]